MMKAAPPFSPVIYGNFHMLPRPIAEPAAAASIPNLELKESLTWLFSTNVSPFNVCIFKRQAAQTDGEMEPLIYILLRECNDLIISYFLNNSINFWILWIIKSCIITILMGNPTFVYWIIRKKTYLLRLVNNSTTKKTLS